MGGVSECMSSGGSVGTALRIFVTEKYETLLYVPSQHMLACEVLAVVFERCFEFTENEGDITMALTCNKSCLVYMNPGKRY